ncbi:hypothetical protein ABPG72_003407 [Tetrahymena utriculariae]
MQSEVLTPVNKVQKTEVHDELVNLDLKKQNQQQLHSYESQKNNSTHPEPNQTTQRYENLLGEMTFQVQDAVIGTSCCCCKKKVGAPLFPSFQNKLDKVRSRPFKRVQMLINPTSGGGNGKKIGNNLIKQLTKHKIPFVANYSASILNFYDFVETFDFEGEDLLMVCGGDGSIFMTLNILAKRQAVEKKLNEKPVKPYPLAVVPGGTGNDFCSSIGFNHIQVNNYVEKYLLEPKVRKVDIGRCRLKDKNGNWKNYYFSCQGGVGFAGRVDQRAKKLGIFFRLKYKVAAFLEVVSAKTDIMTVIIDGKTVLDKGKVKFVEVNNVPRTGGGFRACPIAQVNDGILDLILMYSDKTSRMISVLQAAEKNGLHIYEKECQYYRGKEIRIISHEKDPIDMEIDGEDFKCTEVIFDIDSELVEVVY